MSKKKGLLRIISVCLALSLSVVVGSGAIEKSQKIAPEDKIDSALMETMQKSEADEKIPVYIWTQDIDQAEVEKQTERSVGFTEADLDVVKETVSDDLALRIMSLSNEDVVDENLGQDFADYMSRTEVVRTIEQERTDEYIETRRAVSREKYTEIFTNYKHKYTEIKLV